MAFSSHWSAPGHEATSDMSWRADDVIERSRQRSMGVHRLDPGRSDPPRVLTATALQDHRLPMEDLLDVARSGMESLFLQIRDAGYVILLTDVYERSGAEQLGLYLLRLTARMQSPARVAEIRCLMCELTSARVPPSPGLLGEHAS